jgi:hypothetical protein
MELTYFSINIGEHYESLIEMEFSFLPKKLVSVWRKENEGKESEGKKGRRE